MTQMTQYIVVATWQLDTSIRMTQDDTDDTIHCSSYMATRDLYSDDTG